MQTTQSSLTWRILQNWWSIFHPLSRRWLLVLMEVGLRGRKAISCSTHCMSLLIINDCFRVSLKESREQPHWSHPWTLQINDFKSTIFLVFQTSEIYYKPVIWLLLCVKFFLWCIFQNIMSGPTCYRLCSTPLSGCLCSKCSCNPYHPVGRYEGSYRDVWLSGCCLLTLVSVTSLLSSSCLHVVKLPWCWRGQGPTCPHRCLPLPLGSNEH